MMFPHLPRHDALDCTNNLARSVLRVGGEKQMHVVRRDMERKYLLTVLVTHVAETRFQ